MGVSLGALPFMHMLARAYRESSPALELDAEHTTSQSRINWYMDVIVSVYYDEGGR